MAISQQQVEQACQTMDRCVRAYREEPDKVDPLLEALATRRWLRERYKDSRPAVEPHVQRLAELGRAIMECVRSAGEVLAGEYLNSSRQIDAWERRRRDCRDALTDLAAADGLARFDCPLGSIEVQEVRSATLPRPGTPGRAELIALIRDAGRWEELTAPDRNALVKALDGGVFPGPAAARLTELCQVRTTRRLRAHSRP